MTVPAQVAAVTATPGAGQVALAWSAPAASPALSDYIERYNSAAATNFDGFSTALGARWAGDAGFSANTTTKKMESTAQGSDAIQVFQTALTHDDMWIHVDYYTSSDNGASTYYYVCGRLASAGEIASNATGYKWQLDPGGQVELGYFVGGPTSGVQIAASAGNVYTYRGAGATISMDFFIDGSRLTGFIDGVLLLQATDTHVVSGKYAGFGGFLPNGMVADNFTEIDLNWTTFVDGTSTTPAATVTGLPNASDYVFKVAAINSDGTGLYSPPVWTTTSDVPAAVPAPVAEVSHKGSHITWSAPPSDGGSPVTGFLLERNVASAGWNTVSTLGVVYEYSDLARAVGTAVQYRVSPINVVGTGASTTSNSVTPIDMGGKLLLGDNTKLRLGDNTALVLGNL